MDVRCSKCGTEYEFDDAKVTAAGVTVKCTSCGHVFKVKRDESGSMASSPSTSFGQVGPVGFNPQSTFAKGIDGGEWMVKRIDGQVFRFKELTTLQKWIVERKVGRDDEISKTGKTWKKLGEIAELASFFQVVDAANAALASAQQQAQSGPPSPSLVVISQPPTPMPTVAPAATPTQNAQLSIYDQPTARMSLDASMPGVVPSAMTPMPSTAATPSTPAASPPRKANTQPTEIIQRPTKPGARPSPQSADDVELDDDDPVLRMIRRRRRNAAIAVVLVLLIAGGVAGAVFWPQLGPMLGLAPKPEPVVAGLDDARKALRADKLDDIAKARAALASSPTSPVAVAWIVRLDVASAAHLNEVARLDDVLGDAAGAKKVRDQATTTLGNAYGALNKVRIDAPGLVDGHLASAAYQLERGGLPEQRADLENARAAAKNDASVDAEIAVQQALADAKSALSGGDAKAALDKVPANPNDGRLQYARAALSVAALKAQKSVSDADIASTKAALAQVPATDERVVLLAKIVDAMKPASPAAVVDAGVVASVVDAGPSETKPETTGPAAAAETYDDLMKRAERARVSEKSGAAHDLFAKASKMKPGAPKPWIGLGWTALDLGRNGEAVKDFRRSLDIEESNADAEFGLAEALRFSGQKAEALDAYKTYLKMAPNGKDAGTAKRAIETLQ